ncbi:hypothetical protein DSO57_1025637 [Entomophthora muscae]|uniref:Uncharacterized protein n=1 Tax=Entomophthora muscae TaxID=34485 RepID=A0ACC2RH92_9FUNG|nr:hypothetical protein DSO57_1025637 [Entomophthora muscae]
MMAEQNYEAKRALSFSATPQPLNKKSTLEYIVDPDGPSFPFTLICCKLTSPPMKRTDREDTLSPSVNPDPSCKPPSSPLPPRVYVRNSKWNPSHPNRFVSLKIENDFKNKDHYLCLPDLEKYLPSKDNPRYNIVTVESIPKSPHNKGGYSNLLSETPSLEAFPAGAAAWGHRATSQESKDKGPTAFRGHHCSHPGPLGPAMVSRVNSPGFGPIRSLNTDDGVGHSLSADPADLGPPGYQGPSRIVQPWKFESTNQIAHPSGCHGTARLYNPHDLAQPINSSGATCNSMHMASSEFSNLDKPIMPDDAMEVNSANILINDCNLAGPITPNNAIEFDSPNALINKCNLNEPIKPLDTIETDTPNVLSNNCNSDGPIRPGAAGAKVAHPAQAGCPTPGHPIRSCDAMKTNAPNLLHHYCNSAGPIRSSAANTNYIHTDQAGCPVPNQPIKPCNTKTINAPNLSHYDCNTDEPVRSGAAVN